VEREKTIPKMVNGKREVGMDENRLGRKRGIKEIEEKH
jgi:hypothetical protein